MASLLHFSVSICHVPVGNLDLTKLSKKAKCTTSSTILTIMPRSAHSIPLCSTETMR